MFHASPVIWQVLPNGISRDKDIKDNISKTNNKVREGSMQQVTRIVESRNLKLLYKTGVRIISINLRGI